MSSSVLLVCVCVCVCFSQWGLRWTSLAKTTSRGPSSSSAVAVSCHQQWWWLWWWSHLRQHGYYLLPISPSHPYPYPLFSCSLYSFARVTRRTRRGGRGSRPVAVSLQPSSTFSFRHRHRPAKGQLAHWGDVAMQKECQSKPCCCSLCRCRRLLKTRATFFNSSEAAQKFSSCHWPSTDFLSSLVGFPLFLSSVLHGSPRDTDGNVRGLPRQSWKSAAAVESSKEADKPASQQDWTTHTQA